jgi:hypothetical protein
MDLSNLAELRLPIVDTKTLLDAERMTAAEAVIRAQGRRCRGPLDPQFAAARNQLLEEGRREEASEIDERGRLDPVTGGPRCGRDINDIIVAGAWDGQPHEYTCTCGVRGKYVAPTFAVVDE